MIRIYKKYFNQEGEIAFRMMMFYLGVWALNATPNEEKAKNLKGKMEAFAKVIEKEGTPENLADIKELINEL